MVGSEGEPEEFEIEFEGDNKLGECVGEGGVGIKP